MKNVRWAYVIIDFNGEEIFGTFYEKELQKTYQKVELDLSNYTTKADLKDATDVDTSKFDLESLKSEVDKLDIDKLEKVPTGLNSLKGKVYQLNVDKLVPVPAELSKLNDIVKNNVVKRCI